MTFPAAFTIILDAVRPMDTVDLVTEIILPVALVGTVIADLLYGLMKLVCGR